MGFEDFVSSSVFFVFSGFTGLSGRINTGFFSGFMAGFGADARGNLGWTFDEALGVTLAGVVAGVFSEVFGEAFGEVFGDFLGTTEIGLFTGIEREVGAAWRTSGSLEDECLIKSIDLP